MIIKLESIVRRNRFNLAIVMPTIGAILLIASSESMLPNLVSFNPYIILIGTALMRLPLIVMIIPLINKKNGILLILLTIYVYVIEFVGITQGWPYGEFVYLIELGPMVSGVPMGLPLFFIPLIFNGYLLSVLIVKKAMLDWKLVVPISILLVIIIDLILDPAAVKLGFWSYGGNGSSFYGVPYSNYKGWLLSGAVSVSAIHVMYGKDAVLKRLENCEFGLDDLISFIMLWGIINLYYSNWIPGIMAGGMFIILIGIGWVKLQ
jgi:putative membrane protein